MMLWTEIQRMACVPAKAISRSKSSGSRRVVIRCALLLTLAIAGLAEGEKTWDEIFRNRPRLQKHRPIMMKVFADWEPEMYHDILEYHSADIEDMTTFLEDMGPPNDVVMSMTELATLMIQAEADRKKEIELKNTIADEIFVELLQKQVKYISRLQRLELETAEVAAAEKEYERQQTEKRVCTKFANEMLGDVVHENVQKVAKQCRDEMVDNEIAKIEAEIRKIKTKRQKDREKALKKKHERQQTEKRVLYDIANEMLGDVVQENVQKEAKQCKDQMIDNEMAKIEAELREIKTKRAQKKLEQKKKNWASREIKGQMIHEVVEQLTRDVAKQVGHEKFEEEMRRLREEKIRRCRENGWELE